MVALALAAALAGCSSGPTVPMGQPGHVQGFAGMVAAEEPSAALIGRDVLSAGGSAADAVVAMGFALAVTLPSAAGMGGGGACIVYDSASNKAEAFEFMPRGGVPGLPRGLFAVHAKHGRLHWGAVVTPAEALARFGVPSSRALLSDIAAAGAHVPARFAGLAEGQPVAQVELAALLSRMRIKGPGDVQMAADGAADAAMSRGFVPTVRATSAQPAGDATAHLLSRPAQDPLARQEAAQTGYVALDADGDLAACALTMGRPFGSGRFAANTGMLLTDLSDAAPPPIAVVANHHTKEPRLAVAASDISVVRRLVEARERYEPPPLGSVAAGGTDINAIACGSGEPSAERCEVLTDPNGSGLAIVVGK